MVQHSLKWSNQPQNHLNEKCSPCSDSNLGSLACYLPHVDFFSVWLCWVLIALHELSLVVMSRGYSCSAQAPHWGGFCCCWAKTSVVVACRLSNCGAGLSCSVACGIFPDQGLNQCLLPWQANFYLLHHQASPSSLFSLAISSVN